MIADNLCPDCQSHFDSVRGFLDECGISYKLKPELVRGLDYYTRTTFEIVSEKLGSQNAVGGGGRYDDLIETLGGPSVPAIGFGTGMERIIMLLKERGAGAPPEGGPEVYVVVWDRDCLAAAVRALRSLRKAGVPAEADYSLSSLKSQLRRANRRGVKYVVMLGKDEIARGKAKLKDMRSGEEVEVDMEEVAARLKNKK
jgi:histidyl-tRNA synthetase